MERFVTRENSGLEILETINRPPRRLKPTSGLLKIALKLVCWVVFLRIS
jgi:hypothetical protein